MDLFVYGTLMVPRIMRAVCGYTGSGEVAVLHGYRCRLVQGEVYPGIYPCQDEAVDGLLYRGIGVAQSRRLDRFEDDMYERLQVTVSLANTDCVAHTYVVRRSMRHLLSDSPRDIESFMRDGLQKFVGAYAGFSVSED